MGLYNNIFQETKSSNYIWQMFKDEYYAFTDMLKNASVARTTLYKLIKDGKIRIKEIGSVRLYSYEDVINNKPRKK